MLEKQARLLESGFAFELARLMPDRLPVTEWVLSVLVSGRSVRYHFVGHNLYLRTGPRKARPSRRSPAAECAETVLLTPERKVLGWVVVRHLGTVTSSVIVGTGWRPELNWGARAPFGLDDARLTRLQEQFESAGELAGKELRRYAAQRGAQAVIGVSVDYVIHALGMYVLKVTGTAVRMKPVEPVWPWD